MPLYEYQCTKCKHRFEKIQKFSDPEVKKCPECGGKVEKLLSAPAVQFKGSGWYVTDYAKKGGTSAKSESSESSSASSSDGAKSEAKPKEEKKPAKKK
ncbi:MAG TPA: zinc ribbon domain-containing protein [Terriglobales bacterium]|nr:zinc ribbon domain-containing protein [Terriglobales bacterium]